MEFAGVEVGCGVRSLPPAAFDFDFGLVELFAASPSFLPDLFGFLPITKKAQFVSCALILLD